MRVALYLKHFPPAGTPLIGGTASAVDGLAAGLAQNGAETLVLCEGAARSSTPVRRGYRIECFRNAARYASFSVAPELHRYAAEQLRSGPGLCLVNGMFHPACFALGRALRRHGVPYVAIPHDPYDRWMFRRNPHLKWPYWFLFERRHLSEARAIQVLDRRHEQALRRLGIDTPVIETPNGVSSDAAPPRRAAGAGAPRIVFLGRLDAYNKGLDLLLEAFARVAARADARLTVRGPDWGDRARLERQAAALSIARKVEFLGPDFKRSPVDILAEHELLCLPSRFEGFGLAALEAMLAGCVLLVSERAGAARHVVASACGIAVEPSVAGVEAGLLALLQRRACWPEMGRRGRRYALERLQWKSVAAQALESYRGLLH